MIALATAKKQAGVRAQSVVIDHETSVGNGNVPANQSLGGHLPRLTSNPMASARRVDCGGRGSFIKLCAMIKRGSGDSSRVGQFGRMCAVAAYHDRMWSAWT